MCCMYVPDHVYAHTHACLCEGWCNASSSVDPCLINQNKTIHRIAGQWYPGIYLSPLLLPSSTLQCSRLELETYHLVCSFVGWRSELRSSHLPSKHWPQWSQGVLGLHFYYLIGQHEDWVISTHHIIWFEKPLSEKLRCETHISQAVSMWHQ